MIKHPFIYGPKAQLAKFMTVLLLREIEDRSSNFDDCKRKVDSAHNYSDGSWQPLPGGADNSYLVR